MSGVVALYRLGLFCTYLPFGAGQEAKHMSLWRREAIARFPELHREIADIEGTFLLWLLLRQALFNPAYEKSPPDTETAARVYEYAAWSLKQRSSRVRGAVADEFYERLADDPRTRRDMPRWISQQDFDKIKPAWDYMTPQNYALLRQDFAKNKERIEKQERAKSQKSAFG